MSHFLSFVSCLTPIVNLSTRLYDKRKISIHTYTFLYQHILTWKYIRQHNFLHFLIHVHFVLYKVLGLLANDIADHFPLLLGTCVAGDNSRFENVNFKSTISVSSITQDKSASSFVACKTNTMVLRCLLYQHPSSEGCNM